MADKKKSKTKAKTDRNLTVYDAEKTYKDKIEPLVEEIKKTCAIEKIPFFFTCAVKNDADGTKYVNDGVLTGSYGISLETDHFPPILGVMNGARIIFSTDEDEELPEEISEYLNDGSNEGATDEEDGDPEDDEDRFIGEI